MNDVIIFTPGRENSTEVDIFLKILKTNDAYVALAISYERPCYIQHDYGQHAW